jgi:mRNA-degrading endonuclease RelE of RelBE toxin-antitoxin system
VYKLKFLGKALDDLKKTDRAHQLIIKEKLLVLAENPRVLKNNIKKLSGIKDNYYRLRVGRYRVIFKKEEKRLIIVMNFFFLLMIAFRNIYKPAHWDELWKKYLKIHKQLRFSNLSIRGTSYLSLLFLLLCSENG